jgi:excisionase family DNA binding protein
MTDRPRKGGRKPGSGAPAAERGSHDPGRGAVQFRAGSDELCTVEDAAKRLKLHPRTILRFIHEGRLAGTRVGKSFRILRRDLEAFAGLPPSPERIQRSATVTCVVDIPEVGEDQARVWARMIPGALNSRTSDRAPVRAEIAFDPERRQLKIILVSDPEVVGQLLKLIEFGLQQPFG